MDVQQVLTHTYTISLPTTAQTAVYEQSATAGDAIIMLLLLVLVVLTAYGLVTR